MKELELKYQNPAVYVQEFLAMTQQPDEVARYYLSRSMKRSRKLCSEVRRRLWRKLSKLWKPRRAPKGLRSLSGGRGGGGASYKSVLKYSISMMAFLYVFSCRVKTSQL